MMVGNSPYTTAANRHQAIQGLNTFLQTGETSGAMNFPLLLAQPPIQNTNTNGASSSSALAGVQRDAWYTPVADTKMEMAEQGTKRKIPDTAGEVNLSSSKKQTSTAAKNKEP
ncbi:hypothetical protein EUTSA_v10022921mg [Eutrema salsugineum]|uniref:Uncharacterized protein n=1 Tax=Eutrema salsugineum TaxID=72664 RepID=V4MEX7_EUTSA|nr:hypothetical protein EUTSA_v10022921mg [Eutrema salsugineum]